MDDYEFKLQQLREEYKTASVSERKLIEIRAKLLKISIELRGVVEPTSDNLSDKELNDLFS